MTRLIGISAKWVSALVIPALPLLIGGCASTGNAGTRTVHSGRGVPWTIQCMELQGSGCGQEIERIAEQLRRTEGVRASEVFTRIGDSQIARLYYGLYYCRTAPKTRQRITPKAMNADLALIRRLGGHALPTRYPFPDVGNPQWDLKKVPAEYSLQVAAFEPTDRFAEYKQAAAAYCRLLRDRGYEAYYFHGTANSVVTVGRFGREAVSTPKPMSNVYSAKVRTMQLDEVLKYNLLNGSIYRIKNAAGKLVAVPSRLVLTPQAMQRRDMN